MNFRRLVIVALVVVNSSIAMAADEPINVKSAKVAPAFKNSLGMEFVRIEAGEFWMATPRLNPTAAPTSNGTE